MLEQFVGFNKDIEISVDDTGGMSWSGWIYRYHDGSFDGTYYYSYDEDFSNDSV